MLEIEIPGTWENSHCAAVIVLTRTGSLVRVNCVVFSHLIKRLSCPLCYLHDNSCSKLRFLPFSFCLYFAFLLLEAEAH